MRNLFFLYIFLFSIFTLAAADIENLKYSPQITSIDQSKYYELVRILESQGFMGLEAVSQKAIPFMFVNDIGINPFNNSKVFIKIGIALNDDSFINKIVGHPQGKLLHVKIGESTVALFFTDSTTTDIKSIVNILNLDISINFRIWDLLTTKAHAAEPCAKSQLDNVASAFKNTSISGVAVGAFSCLKDKIRQLPDMLSNKMQVLDAENKVVTKSAEDVKGFWETVVLQGKQLYDTARELPQILSTLLNDFPPIDDEIKSTLLCQFIAESGPSMLLGFIGGLGGTKLMFHLAGWLKALKGLVPLFAKFGNLGKYGNDLMKYLIKKRDDLDSSVMSFLEHFDFKSSPGLLGKLSTCTL